MLSVNHANFRLEGVATITESVGQDGNKIVFININIDCSKVGTVFVYLLSNFRFDNNLLKVAIFRIFTQRTRSLDSGSLCKGQMHGKRWGGINQVG